MGGRPAQLTRGFLGVRFPNDTELTIAVDANHLGRYPAAQLRKIAAQARPAGTPSDPTTWASGNEAVPQ